MTDHLLNTTPSEYYHPTPLEIRSETRRLQQQVPAYALGYEMTAIPSQVYTVLLSEWATYSVPFFPKPFIGEEERNRFLHTDHPTYPPSSLFFKQTFNDHILLAMQPTLEEWCGMELEPQVAYGFRVYHPGSYLYYHVDRIQTHIISASLCIAMHVDEEWSFGVYDEIGKEQFIHLTPGRMILYESARMEHGRPCSLRGQYYVSMFLHYRPKDYQLLSM